jgi:nicotinate-nucleotide adenylyltransferase
MKKIGLYFGTFNPIHVGHLIIANYMADYTDLDEIWLIVSPQNPLKKKESLLADYHRLSLVRVGIESNTKLKASDIEFNLSKPSYTVHTLIHLKEKHPSYHFNLIMGADNLRSFHKWKNHDAIIKEHCIYVYPRILTEQELNDKANQMKPVFEHENIIHCDAPMMKISSSFIRKAIKNKKDVQYLLTEPVHKYVDEMNFYK